MIKKHQKQLGLLLLIVVALFAIQFYWIRNSVSLQRYQFTNESIKEFKGVVSFLESNYYCFKSYATVPIAQWDTFYVMAPKANTNGLDSLNFSTGKAGKLNDSVKHKQLRFPYDANAQIEFSFEFEAPPRNVDTSELTEVDKRMAAAFNRYVRYKNIHLVDTFYLLEQLASINERLPNGIRAEISIISPGSDSVLFKSNRFEHEEAFSNTRLFVNEGSVFLPVVPLEFRLFDQRPFYKSINIFYFGISGLLFLMLVLFLISFVVNLNQQTKLVRLRNELLGNITHEFNTPVTNIDLALKALRVEGDRNETVVGIIKEENHRIKKNIELILSTASIQNGIQDVELQKVSIHSLINMIADSLQIKIDERQGDLNLKLNAKQDYILGDEVHLTNMIHNLVDNATKYCEDKPVVIITTSNTKKDFVLKIRDNGIGISGDNHKLIFEKFFRVNNQNRHETKGFGFGLHYVSMIIKSHKGSIKVESQLGKGAEFIIKIPLLNMS